MRFTRTKTKVTIRRIAKVVVIGFSKAVDQEFDAQYNNFIIKGEWSIGLCGYIGCVAVWFCHISTIQAYLLPR